MFTLDHAVERYILRFKPHYNFEPVMAEFLRKGIGKEAYQRTCARH